MQRNCCQPAAGAAIGTHRPACTSTPHAPGSSLPSPWNPVPARPAARFSRSGMQSALSHVQRKTL